MRSVSLFNLVSLLATAFLVTACEDSEPPFYLGLEPTSVQSNVLVTITRADGTSVPDMIAEIEKLYGVRAQTMNFVVPSFGLEIITSVTQQNPEQDTIEIRSNVLDWATITTEVVNEAAAIPVSFRVNGEVYSKCPVVTGYTYDCPETLPAYIQIYADAFAAKITEGLKEKMKLQIVGTRADGSSNGVVSLSPAAVEYYCLVDRSEITDANTSNSYYDNLDLSKAIFCSGEVKFHLQ